MHALRRFIEQSMRENGWEPRDLVQASGLSKQHVSKLLNDQREQLHRLPEQDTLIGLAKAFRVPLNTVVLRAAQACGVPVDVTEVQAAPSARSLSVDQLLDEIRRRLEGAGDGTSTNRAGRAGAVVHKLPKAPTLDEIESGQAAAHRTRVKKEHQEDDRRS